jgi:hypothetical protein
VNSRAVLYSTFFPTATISLATISYPACAVTPVRKSPAPLICITSLTCLCDVQGAGYIEFASTEDADKAMALDGKELLGRNIRLDWTN